MVWGGARPGDGRNYANCWAREVRHGNETSGEVTDIVLDGESVWVAGGQA